MIWHDGKPFTADDVVFTLDKFLREVSPRWRPIANSQVDKDRKDRRPDREDHAEAALRRRCPGVRGVVRPDHPEAHLRGHRLPRQSRQQHADRNRALHVQGVEERLLHPSHQKQPLLAEGTNPISTISTTQIIPDAAARAVAYETGKVDVLPGGAVDVFDVARLSKLPNTCMTTKGWEMFAPIAWVAPNLRRGVLGNKQFRQGLMYAIDREFGKDMVWDGIGKVADRPDQLQDQVLFGGRSEISPRPGKGQATDQGIRLQGREAVSCSCFPMARSGTGGRKR